MIAEIAYQDADKGQKEYNQTEETFTNQRLENSFLLCVCVCICVEIFDWLYLCPILQSHTLSCVTICNEFKHRKRDRETL